MQARGVDASACETDARGGSGCARWRIMRGAVWVRCRRSWVDAGGGGRSAAQLGRCERVTLCERV
eukprot:3768766-Prymnesium_polylepis.1